MYNTCIRVLEGNNNDVFWMIELVSMLNIKCFLSNKIVQISSFLCFTEVNSQLKYWYSSILRRASEVLLDIL